MPTRDAPALHALDFGGQHRVAVHHDQRADGAREAQRASAPAHVLGHLQAFDQAIDERLCMRGERLGRRRDRGGQQPITHLELLGRETVLAGEALSGLRPVASIVLGRLLGRSGVRECLSGRLRRHTLSDHSDAARRDERLDRRGRQTPIGEQLLDRGAGFALRDTAGVGRQFLTAELDQQRLGHVSSIPRYACETARARARTRPMYATRSVTEIAPRASSWLNACEHLRT